MGFLSFMRDMFLLDWLFGRRKRRTPVDETDFTPAGSNTPTINYQDYFNRHRVPFVEDDDLDDDVLHDSFDDYAHDFDDFDDDF